MAKDYSVQGTTKLQREKYAYEALSIAVLDAPIPSDEAMQLMREYINGKCELSDALKTTINRYKVSEDA